jgi:hypothetical protein
MVEVMEGAMSDEDVDVVAAAMGDEVVAALRRGLGVGRHQFCDPIPRIAAVDMAGRAMGDGISLMSVAHLRGPKARRLRLPKDALEKVWIEVPDARLLALEEKVERLAAAVARLTARTYRDG